MQRCFVLAAFVTGVLTTAACHNPAGNDYACPDIAIPGILVTVVDSATEAPAGRNASIVAKSATFTDSVSSAMSAAFDGPFGLVYLRTATGTYTLTVKQSGYRDWIRTGIVVAKADACSLQTVNVTAKLQK